MKIKDSDLTRPLWAIAAFVLLALVIAAAAPRLTDDVDKEAGRLRVFEGLVAASVVAEVAEASGGGDADALAKVAAELMKDATIRRVFFLSEGGVDAYGIASGREFVYDSQTGAHQAIGEADKAHLDQSTKVSATAAQKGALEVPIRELVGSGAADGGRRRFVAYAPALGADKKVLGVAGIVRETDPVPIAPHLLYGLLAALVGTVLFLVVLGIRRRPREAFAIAAALVFVLSVLGGRWSIASEETRIASDQAVALNGAAAALAVALPGTKLDVELAWKATWLDPASRLVAASADGTTYAPADAAISSRATSQTIMPAAILLLGLVVVAFGIRGAAELAWGIKTQPTTYAYIVPVLLAMAAVIFYPFLKGVEFAFLDASAEEFVGLANFKDVLIPTKTGQTNFWFTLAVTVMWTVLNVTLHVTIGLALALLLNNPKLHLKGAYRVLLVVPWAVPNYITALTWKTMFNTQYGAVNLMLESLGVGGVDWLGRSFWTNFSADLITNVWLGFPFMMVVALGALQSIPKDLYEAADIDGASRWQKFKTITLPLLKPALFPSIILGTIWTFNQFNVIYLVSGGAPDNKTNILITEAYYLFRTLNQYGLAAAYCLMIFLILLTYTVVTNRVTRATEGAFE